MSENIKKQIQNLDIEFQQKSPFDTKIPKQLVEISLNHNHQMAHNKIEILLAQNIVFSQCLADYYDRCDQVTENKYNTIQQTSNTS